MANNISDTYMKSLLKTVYESGVANDKYQSSQFLADMVKEGAEFGKEIKYAAQYGDGGNFGSEYDLISNNKTTGAQNLEWTAECGRLVGLFDVSQPEILMSDTETKAYMDILANKMSGCFSGMSRTLATYLYGGEAGVIDQIQSDITISSLTGVQIPVTSAGALKMDVGTRIVFATAGAANTAVPKSPLAASGAYATVTGWDDESVTVTFESAFTGVTLYAGDYIELYTARRGNAYNGIQGLPDIIPSVADRTGDAWFKGDGTGYIEQDFRGVDRSVAISKLAGQFVKADATATTPNTDALVTLLKKGKRAGGRSEEIKIVINDNSFENLAKELAGNVWQSTNAANAERQSATTGKNSIGVAFEEAFTNKLYTDAYCPEKTAYMYRKNDFKFKDVGNVSSRVLNPVANDSEGKYEIKAVGNQGFGNTISSQLNVDKLFNVVPNGSNGAGPLFEISAFIYGQFIAKDTAGSGVAKLTA